MQSDHCPAVEELSGFVLGTLDLQSADLIADHIESCPACEETVQKLETDSDTVIERLRTKPAEDPFTNETGCQQALALINAIGKEPSFSVSAQQVQTAADQPELDTIGQYQLLVKLGEGGMGTVYKALHTSLKRIVALKVLPAERMKNLDAVARFQREMEAVGRLDHPNIVRATDAGEADDTHFLVMEYVDGIDLSDLVRQHGPLAIPDACEIVQQAAIGLQHAHEHKLVHRDIKPSNLMLAAPASGGRQPTDETNQPAHTGRSPIVKLLDLGLAMLADDQAPGEELTTSGQIMGTVDYMAPEQATDIRHVDIRADLYSLGCTFYKLLTGHAPFSNEKYSSTFERIRAHVDDPAPPISEHRPDIPAELATIIDRLLAKNPADRYDTPDQLAAALAPFTVGSNLAGLMAIIDTQPAVAPQTDNSQSSTIDPVSSALTVTLIVEPAASSQITGEPDASASGYPTPPRHRLITTAAALLFVIAFGAVIYFNTGNGTVELTINADDITATLDGKTITLKSPRDTITVTAGGHEMEVTKDGFTSWTKRFRVVRNGKVELSAILKPTASGGRQPTDTFNPRELWKITPQTDPLPGLLPQPAQLPGIGRWQVETRRPRSALQVVAVSPDGTLIACGGNTGAVRLYDATTFQLLSILPGHTKTVSSLVWSPDGKLLASASYDKHVFLWSPAGKLVRKIMMARDGQHKNLDWSPDSSRFVVASPLNPTQIYNTTGARLQSFITKTGRPTSVSWHPQDNRIAIGTAKGTIEVWPLDGDQPSHILRGHEGHVYSVDWSPDGKQLASGSDDKTIRLWAATGKPTSVLDEHDRTVKEVVWSPSGKLLASSSDDTTVRLWSADGKPLATFEDHRSVVESVAWSPAGDWLVSAGADRTLRRWSVDGKPGPMVAGERASVAHLTFSPNSRHIAATGLHNSDDWRVRVWDMDGKNFHEFGQISPSNYGNRSLLAWNADGSWLAFNNQLWSPENKPTRTLGAKLHGYSVVAWSGDGRQLAIALRAGEKTLQLWQPDGAAGPILKHDDYVHSLDWTADGKRLASGSKDKTVRLWNADGSSGPIIQHDDEVVFVAWSSDGKSLLTQEKEIAKFRLWSAEGQEFGQLKHPGSSIAATWSPDGRWIATTCSDTLLRLWNPETPAKPVVTVKASETGGNIHPAWKPDSKQIAVVDPHSGKVHIFNVDGSERATLLRNSVPAYSVAWSDDGRHIAVGSQSNTIAIWDAKTARSEWVGVNVAEKQSVIIDPTGHILHGDPETVENELVYIVEAEDGQLKLLKPSEFQKLVLASGGRQPTDSSNLTGTSNQPADTGRSPDPYKLNRRAAEWVLSLDGHVSVVTETGNTVSPTQLSELPKEAFVVIYISMPGNELVTDEGLKNLRGLRNLQFLGLASTPISDVGLEQIASLTSLRNLDLGGSSNLSRFTDAGIAALQSLKRLNSLGLGDTKISGAALAQLGSLTSLTYLHFPNLTDDDLKIVSRMKSLKKINLAGFDIQGPGLEHMQDLPNLNHLWLNSTPLKDTSIKYLKQLKSLTLLYLNNTRISAEGVAELQQALPNCEINHESVPTPVVEREVAEHFLKLGSKVTLRNAYIGSLVINDADQLPDRHLGVLAIELANRKLTEADLSQLLRLKHLKSLNLKECSLPAGGLAPLNALKSLKFLGLGQVEFPENGLEFVAELKNLRGLSLGGTNIDDADLKYLAGLQDLDFLSLNSCLKITGPGLEYVGKLDNLYRLLLDGTSVDDASLEHIESLDGLLLLSLIDTDVTTAGVEKLSRALPDCFINYGSPSHRKGIGPRR